MKNDVAVAMVCLLALTADWLFIRIKLAASADAIDPLNAATFLAAAAFALVSAAVLATFLQRIIRRAATARFPADPKPPIGLFRQYTTALFATLLRKGY